MTPSNSTTTTVVIEDAQSEQQDAAVLPKAKAFGLGVAAPGGGFVYTKSPVRAAASAGAFGASIGLLWGLGPVLAPPGVWLGSAALAARRAKQHSTWSGAELAVPAGIVALSAAGVAARRRAFRAGTRRGEEMNERLSQITFPISTAPAAPPVTESTPEDLAALRYALDLGLQPLERWDGFRTIDQFRESALRYQLQFLQYALATSQYTRTPAFTGYLSEAQRNAIEKMLQPKVWKYWRASHCRTRCGRWSRSARPRRGAPGRDSLRRRTRTCWSPGP
jgi:hypothetical protein